MSDPTPAELRRRLHSADRHEQAEAAVLAAQSGLESLLPELRELTEHQDDIVAIAAMYATWLLGEDTVSAERLVAAAASHEEECRQQAAQVVHEIGEPIVAKLEAVLAEQPDTVEVTLELLDEVEGPEATRALAAFRSDIPEAAALARELLEDRRGEDDA